MSFRILRAVRHLPLRPLTAAAILLGLAWLTGHTPRLANLTEHARNAGLIWAGLVLGFWGLRWLAPEISTRRWVDRRDDASRHARGVATWTDVGEQAGAGSVRGKAAQLRPALAARYAGFRRPARRWAIPVTQYAVPLVRSSWLPVSNTVWSTCEDVTLRIGGPRTGKSGSLACHALDAPGALLVTTSRTDLLGQTRDARAVKGRVEVFNPTGLGDLPSTVRWTPLAGCTDYATAIRRAADLIPLSGVSSDAARWDEQARGLLTTLLHAAALSGGTMRTVLTWISPADSVARDEILTALRRASDPALDRALIPANGSGAGSAAYRTMVDEIRGLYGTNDRTLTSITTTLLPHLRWVNNPTIAAVGDAALDDPALLDVAEFVATGTDSLYLIGREGGAHTLIGALTAEVAHQVRMHAERLGGRLEPPMTAILDEAPLTCGPIPLHDWTADMGGRNFTLHIAAQSLAQLRDVWGRDRAGAILGNTNALLVFGGIKSAEDLQELSTLCGSRLVAVDDDDNRPLPVMTPAEISTLPTGKALVLRNGMRPVVGRAPMVWHRRPARLRPALRWIAATLARLVRFIREALTALVVRPGTATGAAAAAAGPVAAGPVAGGAVAGAGTGGRTADSVGPSDGEAAAAPADALLAELEELFARPGLDLDDPTQVHGRNDTDASTDGDADDDADEGDAGPRAGEGGAA